MKKLFLQSMLLSLLFAPEAAEIESRYSRNKKRVKHTVNTAFSAEPAEKSARSQGHTEDRAKGKKKDGASD